MHDELKNRLRRLLEAACGISIVLCGLCLMAACVGIYRRGDAPFSRQAVAEAFAPIAPIVWLCLGLTVLSCLYRIAVPAEKGRTAPQKSVREQLARLRRSVSPENCDPATQACLARLTRREKLLRLARGAVCTAAGIVFGLYALNGRHFSGEDINGSMIHAMLWLLPCLAVALGTGLGTGLALERCAREQLALLRGLPRASAEENRPSTAAPAVLRLVLLALGAGLVIFGAATGGIADVLAKAINICTECIGLG